MIIVFDYFGTIFRNNFVSNVEICELLKKLKEHTLILRTGDPYISSGLFLFFFELIDKNDTQMPIPDIVVDDCDLTIAMYKKQFPKAVVLHASKILDVMLYVK